MQGQIDQRLDTQIAFLSSMLRSQNGVLTLAGNADGPPFDGHPRGWYWEAIGPNNTLRSRALGDRDLNISKIAIHPPPPPPPPAAEDRPPPPGSRPAPADDMGPDQQWLHFRIPVSYTHLVYVGWLLQRQVTKQLAIGGEIFHQTATRCV